ncbi:MAG: hypothetical protein IID45_05515 [Planctomycetes bacterium]|nr:hypothetical protein [Planctomycetota bacterium]
MSISFQCDSCGRSFIVDEAMAGRKAKCKNCRSTVVVPELEAGLEPPIVDTDEPPVPQTVEIQQDDQQQLPRQDSRPDEPPAAASGEISFQCDSCGRTFIVDKSMAGRKAKCKKCRSTVVVPELQIDFVPPQPLIVDTVKPLQVRTVEFQRDEHEELTQRDFFPDQASASADGEISFLCHYCNTAISVPRTKIGKSHRCRKCHVSVTVPASSDDEPFLTPTSPAADGLEFVDDAVNQFDKSALPFGLRGTRGSRASGLAAIDQLDSLKELQQIAGNIDYGQYREANNRLKSIRDRHRDDVLYEYLCGLVGVGLGNYIPALDQLEAAAAGGISTPALFAARGKAELELGRYSAAITALDEALVLIGKPEINYLANLAKAYEGANMRQEAKSTWKLLADIAPRHPDLIEHNVEREERRARRRRDPDTQRAMDDMETEPERSGPTCWVTTVLRFLCSGS